ncbi:MAG: hypothetical protein DRN10_01960, partial [Thermoplasmata archaeon]
LGKCCEHTALPCRIFHKESIARHDRKEVGKHGITVNGIMPGMIETERMKKLAEDRAKREEISIEEAMGKYAEPIPAGRLGMPEEIGYLAAFLSSEQASYINGTMIPVDGGRLNSVF